MRALVQRQQLHRTAIPPVLRALPHPLFLSLHSVLAAIRPLSPAPISQQATAAAHHHGLDQLNLHARALQLQAQAGGSSTAVS